MSNFVQNCLSGDAFLSEIDDYIDEWHDGPSELPIHEFLGLSEVDYHMWVRRPDSLPFIIAAHKQHIPVRGLIERYENQGMLMAARSEGADRLLILKQWLQQQGLWG